MKISAVVVTQNEERNIRRCLASLRFADEIVVVDAFSEDRTVEIAREYGARVVQRIWDGFSNQKQYAVDQAVGEWVLLVDSDEEVTTSLAEEIRAVVGQDTCDAYRLRRRNQFLGQWIRHGPWSADYEIRLFRKGHGRIARRPVHEGVQAEGVVEALQSPLNHYTHQTLSDSFRRLNRYTTLEAEERAGRRRIRLADVVFPPTAVFVRYYFFKGYWREGVRGFLLAAISAMYKSVLYVKIRFLQNEKPSHRMS